MSISRTVSIAALGALGFAVACGDRPGIAPSPVTTSAVPGSSNAAGDGSTLKATPPTPQSPIGGGRVTSFTPLLTVGNSSNLYADAGALSYEFELNRGGTRIAQSPIIAGGNGTTSWEVPQNVLDVDQQYGWRARAVLGAAVGPWSTMASFLSLDQPEGYITGDELYDPLVNGRTIGRISGPTTFIPGQGIRLDDFTSNVEYSIPVPNGGGGELSMRVRNVIFNTQGGKTKIMSMRRGGSDITTNEYRVTIEKRGDPAGIIAWRFRYGNEEQVDTEGAERRPHSFNPALEYFWRARWSPGRFDLEIFENGPAGNLVYSFGKSFSGAYRPPDDHRVYIGAPVGKAGPLDASVPGIIVSHVWMSSRPRPAFANR